MKETRRGNRITIRCSLIDDIDFEKGMKRVAELLGVPYQASPSEERFDRFAPEARPILPGGYSAPLLPRQVRKRKTDDNVD